MNDLNAPQGFIQESALLQLTREHLVNALDIEFSRQSGDASAQLLDVLSKLYHERNLPQFFTKRSIDDIKNVIFMQDDKGLLQDYVLNVTARFTHSLMMVDPSKHVDQNGYYDRVSDRVAEAAAKAATLTLSAVYDGQQCPLEPLALSIASESKGIKSLLQSNAWLLVVYLMLHYFSDTIMYEKVFQGK